MDRYLCSTFDENSVLGLSMLNGAVLCGRGEINRVVLSWELNKEVGGRWRFEN